MRLGLSLGLGDLVLRRGFSAPVSTPTPAPYAAPPEDWRMPATVAVSSGLTADESALAAAQGAADAKTRPGITVADAGSESIEWIVGESGDVILSFVPSTTYGTYTVELNDVDQAFAKQFPEGSDEKGNSNVGSPGRRQAIVLAVSAGDVICLTVAASGGAATIYPLLHKLPETGPWDGHLIFGASREDYGLASRVLEGKIIATYANRDPIVFNYARAGYDLNQLSWIAGDAAAAFGGAARYAFCGSVMGNTISANRPWESSQTAAMTTDIERIKDQFEGAGMEVCFGSTSYRNYDDVGPLEQADGSMGYNDNILFPLLAASLPDTCNSALARAHVDEYLLTLLERDQLQDQVHGTATQYNYVQNLIRDTWIARIYSGLWNYTSQPELRVVAAEVAALDASDAATAMAALNEADYAMLALAVSSAKTDFEARLDAIRAATLFKVADAAVTTAESEQTQAAVDAAQAAIDAASAAGADVTALKARLDSVVVVSGVIIGVNFYKDWQASYLDDAWNNHAQIISSGVVFTDLLDDQGDTTGYNLEVSPGFASQSSTPGATGAPAGSPFPDYVMYGQAYASDSAVRTWELKGLPAGKKVRVQGISSTTRSSDSYTGYLIAGYDEQFINAQDNLGNYAEFADVIPEAYDDDGVTRYKVVLQTRASWNYHDVNALRFIVSDA